MDDKYSAKTITGTNWVRYDIHIYAKKNARLILCFHVGTGKNVYIVLSGSPRQSSMALAGGLRGNRKGLYRLHLACLWWSSRLYSCWASSLYLWTRVSREHRRSCTHTQILYTSTDTGDISDMGYSIYRRHWLDRMHLIIGVFLTPGGESVQEFRAVLGGRGTVKLFSAVRMFVHRLREFVLPPNYLRVARFDFYRCSHKI